MTTGNGHFAQVALMLAIVAVLVAIGAGFAHELAAQLLGGTV